jgi:hypothetical protein
MNSPRSDYRDELVGDASLPPPSAIRYPHSAVRYPLLSLADGGRQPAKQPAQPSLALARSRRMNKTARMLWLWIPLWYALAQIALLAWIDERWEPLRVRIEKEKWEQLHERLAEMPDRPLVLMFGSSRTDWGFQAGRMSGRPGPDGRPLLVYNFGVPTTGPLHEWLYVHDLLDEGIRPRLVLLEFLPTHLNQPQRGVLSEENFTMVNWLTAHQLRFFSSYFWNTRRAWSKWLEARLAPCYAFRLSFNEYVRGVDRRAVPLDQAAQPMDAWGSRLLASDPGTPEYRAFRWSRALEMYAESLRRFRLNAKVVQSMHDMLDRCQREHVPVALVVMPTSKEFNALFSPQGYAQVQQVLAQLRQQYGVEVIDASDWLEREDFDDGHHLLKSGGRKFTDRLSDEVQTLLARTSAP